MTSFRTYGRGCLLMPAKTREHLLAHPGVSEHLPAAASLITLPSNGRMMVTEVDLGHYVGRSQRVVAAHIKVGDTALFCVRAGRTTGSRVEPGGVPVATSIVSVIAKPDRRGDYILVTAWIGPLAPPEPTDPRADQEAINFWCQHALIPSSADGPVYKSTWAAEMQKAIACRNSSA